MPNIRVKLFNTFAKKKEFLKPLKAGTVKIYTCGPTVYYFPHIGNMRTYVFEDILERALANFGYRIKRVMNVTDVGHLTDDGDGGEDKLEKGALRDKKSPLQVAAFYTKAFVEDCRKLNIAVPKIFAPATKFIDAQIDLAKKLERKGYTYETESALYFDVSKFKKYSKFAGQSIGDKITGARKEVVADSEKKNPADFVLWFKRVGRFKNHVLHWPSPWGEGFPGWHIECSAIAHHYLGQPIDIHAGGVDHIGTHHPNEIAQSESAYGAKLAKIWLHGEHLLVNGAKMSKSLGNFYTISDLKAENIQELAFRLLVLGTHYRAKLNFTWESMRAADVSLSRLREQYSLLKSEKKPKILSAEAKQALSRFKESLADDLNTPKALAVLYGVIKDKHIAPSEKKYLLDEFDSILRLDLSVQDNKDFASIPKEILEKAATREALRKNKQFMQADALRNELYELGYILEDTEAGPIVRVKK